MRSIHLSCCRGPGLSQAHLTNGPMPQGAGQVYARSLAATWTPNSAAVVTRARPLTFSASPASWVARSAPVSAITSSPPVRRRARPPPPEDPPDHMTRIVSHQLAGNVQPFAVADRQHHRIESARPHEFRHFARRRTQPQTDRQPEPAHLVRRNDCTERVVLGRRHDHQNAPCARPSGRVRSRAVFRWREPVTAGAPWRLSPRQTPCRRRPSAAPDTVPPPEHRHPSLPPAKYRPGGNRTESFRSGIHSGSPCTRPAP